MAAGTLPAPGTKYGPCTEACKHHDCASLRTEAETPCHICGKTIGYEIRFYVDEGHHVHALCLESQIEREREDEANA